MKRNLFCLLLIGLLLLSLPALAAFDELRLGARPLGMGGAYTAIADDANAVYWNPAGLALAEKNSITSMHTNKFGIEDLNLDFIAGSIRYEEYAFGLGWIRESTVLEEENNSVIVENRYAEKRLIFSAARSFSDRYSLGVNIKQLELETTEGNHRGTAGDLGLMAYINPETSFALTVKNIFGEVNEEKAARSFHIGLGYRASDNLLISGEISSKDNPTGADNVISTTHLGMEYNYSNLIFRIGVDDTDLTGGIGFEYQGLVFDYAFSQHELGNTHRISAGYSF